MASNLPAIKQFNPENECGNYIHKIHSSMWIKWKKTAEFVYLPWIQPIRIMPNKATRWIKQEQLFIYPHNINFMLLLFFFCDNKGNPRHKMTPVSALTKTCVLYNISLYFKPYYKERRSV